MNDSDINKLGLVALKLKDNQPLVKKALNFDLVEKDLPEMTKSLKDWADEILDTDTEKELFNVFQYLINRGMDIEWYPWHWSQAPGYRDRLLIPFFHDGKIVGFTGRKIREGKPKYLTDAQPSYVFNIDRQQHERKYLIVVEGQFDAIAIDGVAIMSNEPNEAQCSRINALGREVIVVPDRDQPGAKLIKAALDNNWAVSIPPWAADVKDTADAVQRYGRLYTLTTILHYKETNEIKIQLLKKKLESINE